MCRYSPASSSRVQAEPRSGSSAHCTSSSTSTSPESGAISTVQQMIGACSLTRSSPVTRPTRVGAELGGEAPVRLLGEHPQRRRRRRRGRAPSRTSSAWWVLPEFVGPRCATTVSGSVRRCGSVISIAPSARSPRLDAGARRAWRSERLGRFARPRPCLRPPGMQEGSRGTRGDLAAGRPRGSRAAQVRERVDLAGSGAACMPGAERADRRGRRG